MSGAGERRDGNGLRGIPSLDPRRENEGQPMGGNGGMEKGDSKARERDGGENGLVHFATAERESVGLVGFEPTASASRTQRSTKLSHSPNCSLMLSRLDAPLSRAFREE